MPTIAAVPFVLKNATLQVGTDNYESAVRSVRFLPNSEVLTFVPITPAGVVTDTTAETWTCTIELAQDWTTANSLAQYLLANKGTKKTMIFKPQGATTGSPVFTADVMVAAPPIGGEVNTFQLAEVTMGVVGAPVKTAAP